MMWIMQYGKMGESATESQGNVR